MGGLTRIVFRITIRFGSFSTPPQREEHVPLVTKKKFVCPTVVAMVNVALLCFPSLARPQTGAMEVGIDPLTSRECYLHLHIKAAFLASGGCYHLTSVAGSDGCHLHQVRLNLLHPVVVQ